MATLSLKSPLSGISGKIGNLILRQVRGKTVVSLAPSNSSDQTEKQKIHRNRFRLAAAYAKKQMANPATQKLYALIAKRKKYTHAFAAAVKDYMTHPEIDSIDVSAYAGKPRERIVIRSCDDLKIENVFVEISQSDCTLIESGMATRDPGGQHWRYVTNSPNPNVHGTRIKIIAVDRPGNKTTKEVVIGDNSQLTAISKGKNRH